MMHFTTCSTCNGRKVIEGERCFDCNGMGSHAEEVRDIDLEGDGSMDPWSDDGDYDEGE